MRKSFKLSHKYLQKLYYTHWEKGKRFYTIKEKLLASEQKKKKEKQRITFEKKHNFLKLNVKRTTEWKYLRVKCSIVENIFEESKEKKSTEKEKYIISVHIITTIFYSNIRNVLLDTEVGIFFIIIFSYIIFALSIFFILYL